MTVRVVVADDHPMFRFGVSAVLAQADDVEVVAEAASGRELLAVVERHAPDVVITDITMPDLDGVAATTRLLAARRDLGVLVLTMHTEDEQVFAALRAGARGYLVKGADGEAILRAVRAVAAGETVYGPEVGRRISAFYAGAAEEPVTARAFPDLTPREQGVLEHLAGGARNSEIARRLGMSEKTVRNHVSAILLKLQVPDRTAAALKARAAGVAPPAS